MTAAPLALTMGDPSGIGPDITLLAFEARSPASPPFVWIGDPSVLEDRKLLLNQTTPIRCVATPDEAKVCFRDALPVLKIKTKTGEVIPGRPSQKNASSILDAIETAVDFALSGAVSGVVTNPICKHSLYEAGFCHEGHTDFIAALCRARGFPATPVMMLEACGLRTVPITIHIPLSQVAVHLRREEIVSQSLILNQSLTRYLGIASPRLALCALNPHAGEKGSMGTEEETVLCPALCDLQAEGVEISGPYSADSLFAPAHRAHFDAIVCMYHDQALIPVKMLGFFEGVNITLGLPFVRTSPDHGTAFSLAGTGQAHPKSLLMALAWAQSAS